MFVEGKWQTLTANITGQIFDDLKEKSKYVYWNNEKRQEYFTIIVKKNRKQKRIKA
jgi:hypothetical protein